MAGIGVVLAVLTPAPAATLGAFRAPQQLVDADGTAALVLAVVGGLAWLVWAWGVLGLLLTALGALPGLLGRTARQLLRAVLPAGARRAAALTLGVGVALNAPLFAAAALASPLPGSAVTGAPIPDWPAPSADVAAAPVADQPAVPDWPTSVSTTAHVVVAGDCLWAVAASGLQDDGGRTATNAEIAHAVEGWWSANAGVIGPDPDLLLPGQVLTPPDAP
jgi:nucleoid-associated protein YgaU